MSEELKIAQDELCGEVKALGDAVREAKAQFGETPPGDVMAKLEEMSASVTALSTQVRELDSAPAYKRAFEDVETKVGGETLETKLRRPSGDDGDIAEIQRLQDAMVILQQIKGRHDARFDVRDSKTYGLWKAAIERKTDTFYAPATADKGAEWIPTGYSADLVALYELRRQVAGLFTNLTMTQNPMVLPRQTGKATAFLKGVGSNAAFSESTTDNFTLSTVTVAAASRVAYEMEEDSIVAMIPFIRVDIANALADAEEAAIINGDTTGTHMDSDVTDAADARKAWKGLRKHALTAAKSDFAAAPTTAKLRKLRSLMGKYGLNPNDLAWLVSPVGVFHVLGMAEVLTVDKVGPQATLLSGQIATFDGSPVVPSAAVREDLNATAVYDGTTKTKTEILCVFRPGFVIGQARAPMTEADRDIIAGTDCIVASMRKDFKPRYAETTEPIVAVGYNIPNALA